ncbi:MAG TPA: hypothetical protein V6D37_00375 [Candidatus Sericytochromatia bacterium]
MAVRRCPGLDSFQGAINVEASPVIEPSSLLPMELVSEGCFNLTGD